MSAISNHRSQSGTTSHDDEIRPLTIPIHVLRSALHQAAEHGAVAAVAYGFAILIEHHRGASIEVLQRIGASHAEELAAGIEMLIDHWSTALADDAESIAPLGWAIQEIIEWIDASYRFHWFGETYDWLLISWSPNGSNHEPLTLNGVVEQRLQLLLAELSDHDVITTDLPSMTAADIVAGVVASQAEAVV